MKLLKKISIALASLLVAAVPVGVASVKWSAKTQEVEAVADSVLLGNATGYTKASDVKYNSGTYIANWGAREEDCTFLTTYAQSFYTGNYTYETLSQQSGGSSQSNASSSTLYKSLQTLMKSNHEHETNYGETRYKYCYTDCVNGNSNYISSFYSATKLGGEWGSSPGWNREHTWPNSKGLGGNDENDIMMLRPTATSENSSRGNTAYGQSSGYYNPNSEGGGKVDLRGDCARICLYVYVRWGNTNYMWGTSGVMESMNVLLQWMEEDPVDTWEMGRNDSVQSITGTRNVFVDYPEFAWQLFGKTAPDDMPTPSGKASNGQAGGNGGNSSSDSYIPDDSSDTDSGDIDVPNYSTPEDILNALYALSDGETVNGSFTLTGKITALDSYNNPTIVVEGFEDMPVYCYRLQLPNNKVGDIITVTANSMKNYMGTYEFMNCTLVSSQGGDGNGGSSSDSSSSGSNSNDASDSDSSGTGGEDVATGLLAKFDFGANGSASHSDGTAITGSKSYSEDGYTLTITDLTQVYDGACDAKGNSCIKFGSSKATGGFTFTVPSDVEQVLIYAAQYKADPSTLIINGVTHTLTKASNDGQYDVIVVDTSSTKTVKVETKSGATRAMINTIEFLGADDGEDSSSDSSSDSNSEDSSTDSSSDSNFEDSSTDTSSDSNTNSSNDDSSGDVNTCEHKFGGWIVDVEPTETTDGSQHRTCRLCDFVEEEIIPALGDNSSDTGSSNEDSSDAPNVCEHDFSDWITVKEPTETTDGKAIRTCWICGDKEEKVLPATGSTSSDSSDDSGSDTSSESGADSNSDSSDLGSTSGGVSSSTTDDTVNSDNDEISNSDTAPIGQVGCGASISIGVSLISFAVLVGCGFVFKKKKEK